MIGCERGDDSAAVAPVGRAKRATGYLLWHVEPAIFVQTFARRNGGEAISGFFEEFAKRDEKRHSPDRT